jgi:hypothetical protein
MELVLLKRHASLPRAVGRILWTIHWTNAKKVALGGVEIFLVQQRVKFMDEGSL